jgi:hypothetical protein
VYIKILASDDDPRELQVLIHHIDPDDGDKTGHHNFGFKASHDAGDRPKGYLCTTEP